MSLRIAFMGTPDFAVPALSALISGPHEVVAVYSQPPKPKGRGHQLQPSPVHALAERHHIPVFTPKTLRDPVEQEKFSALNLDLAVVAAYGLILPQVVLDAPRAGCVNLHGSLLPRWRGAAPIQRAILAGDAETGICLMKMEAGLDTGPVYARAALPITAQTTSSELHDDMAKLAARLLMQHLDAIAEGQLPALPQSDAGVTYAQKVEKSEARLDWRRPAIELERKVRAFTPWPGAEFELAGEVLKVIAAEVVPQSGVVGVLLDDQFTIACGEGALRLTLVQRPGRTPVDGAACLRGLHLSAGTRLIVE